MIICESHLVSMSNFNVKIILLNMLLNLHSSKLSTKCGYPY